MKDERVDDLRSTNDALSRDIENLEGIEQRKTELDPSAPEILDLSRDARRAAERIRGLAVLEEQLAEQIAEDNDSTGS